ncbi:shikimate kinase AroK [Gynuella sp.]|uniref:shikimate kinase AroK n=1 Tax=Gynuella sp. TaxID=2969146 RepID=UPI003D0A3FA9
MSKIPNIYLIGPMGAGKSTIGRLLSEEFNLPFIDSDKIIEERAGADIPWIFDLEGEEGFRRRELSVIEDLTQLESVILATGGGAILKEENRRNLRSRGVVIYLKASVRQQIERTEKDRNRPLLQTDNREEVLRKLVTARSPLYDETADIVVDTDHKLPKNVIKEIIEQLSSREWVKS